MSKNKLLRRVDNLSWKIVLDNSPHAERVRVLEVDPVLEPYELGLFTLKRHLHNPLVDAFWSLLPDEVDQ